MGTPGRAWFAVVLLVLAAVPSVACQRIAKVIPGSGLAGRPAASGTATPGSGADGGLAIPDTRLALSVVQIAAVSGGTVVRSGSGVVVDEGQRLILTSYEIVQPSRPDGTAAYSTIMVSANRRLGAAPTTEFEADLVAADPANGIAVLRVNRDAGASSLSAGAFNLPAAILGDARTAAAGLPMRVLGHAAPDAAGRPQPLVITKSTVTGVRGTPGATNRTWLKMDARLPFAAAGGAAFNQSGALIGIMAQDRYFPGSDVGQVRPLELAQPVIDRAKKETGRYPAPLAMRTNAPGTTRPLPADGAWISAPVFAANAIQNASSRDLFDYGTRFPAGRPAIYYEYVLEGVPGGTVIEERWFLDDAPQDALSSSYRWDGRNVAVQGDRIAAPTAAGIARGRWRLEIWAGGALRSQATALVGVTPRDPKVTGAGSAASATPDGRPQAPLGAGAGQLLVFLDFTGMEGAQTMDWLVFHNNQRVYTSQPLPWEYGDSGRTWVGYAPGQPLAAGKWEIEFHADGRVLGVVAATITP